MNDNKLLEFVGSRIRYLRQARNLSQEEFAFSCDLDRSYISDIERGKRNVSLLNLSVIANVLQIPLSKLFQGLPTTLLTIEENPQKLYKVYYF